MASALMNPPKWDEKSKRFDTWLREVKVWKAATDKAPGLSGVHGLQLALHLPENSDIRNQVFDTLEPDDMKGDEGFKSVVSMLEKHYAKDENTSAFQTWKEFKELRRANDQSVDSFIMVYEQYKSKMKRFKMDLTERIHGLNLLCSANLNDDALRICMREVDGDLPDEMYDNAKKALKKYYGVSAVSSSMLAGGGTIPGASATVGSSKAFVKEEDTAEYESFVTWRKSQQRKNKGNGDQKWTFQGKQNPLGANGSPLQCGVCRSIAHFARDCPHSSKKDNVTYMAASNQIFECDMSAVTVGDSLNHMILDTGCPQNVCGKAWFDCFVETFSPAEQSSIKKERSDNQYKFGGGTVWKSLFQVTLPVSLLGVKADLKFDVVEPDIPLLFGKQSMREWQLVIDTSNETAMFTLNGERKVTDLYTSASGHWCLNLSSPLSTLRSVQSYFSIQGMSKGEKSNAALHIHRQFCHPPFHFLEKVLNGLGDVDDEFMSVLKDVSDNCLVCKRFKPSMPKPAVGHLLDPDTAKFNEIVTGDLKVRNGKLILYLIDIFSRFTRAIFIPNKKPETVIGKIISIWTSLFGSPGTLLMDNGGEFANDEMRELGNHFGIRIKHTAAYAPWANGLNERNHYTVDVMMDKMIEDCPTIAEETALQYAVSVRNCWMFVRGFTPCQLAFGHNPRLPTVNDAELPALSSETSSPVVAEYFNNLELARQAFVQAENSSKLKRALKKSVRSHCSAVFVNGDEVFYKNPNNRRWQGPATVIGQDRKVVLLRHGSVLRRVHPCRLQHVKQSGQLDSSESSETVEAQHTGVPIVQPVDNSSVDDISFGNIDEPVSENPVAALEISGSSCIDEVHEPSVLPEQLDAVDTDLVPVDVDETQLSVPVDVGETQLSVPKKGDVVRYKSDDEWKEVKILGRAGRKGGQYDSWLNVSDGSGEFSIDWSSVPSWCMVDAISDENPCETYLMSDISEDEFQDAKLQELQKWKLFYVYDEVQRNGQKFLCGRWVCSRKYAGTDYINKARYVVKGFQEKVDVQSDSPTGSKECFRLILLIVASKHWQLCSLDVKSAFLQGKVVEREIFIKPPVEAKASETTLWKLKKCVYGLNDAARMWYFAVLDLLESFGCTRSKFDYGVFVWKSDGVLQGVMEVHVDDLLWAGTDSFCEAVVKPFCSHFQIGSESTCRFPYLGLQLEQHDHGITVNQSNYIEGIEQITLSNSRKSCKESLCDSDESSLFRRAVGQLNWVSGQTRPDIAFDVCYLSSVMSCPKVADVLLLNKCILKLKNAPVVVTYPALSNIESSEIVLYSDASLANLPSGRSVGGFVLLLVDANGSCGPLMWKSCTLKRVVRSTLAAEVCAGIEGLDAAYFVQCMFSEMLQSRPRLSARTDNRPFFKNAMSTTMVSEHRLRVDLAAVKEMIAKGELGSLSWVPKEEQLADCLTKRGANPRKLIDCVEAGKL